MEFSVKSGSVEKQRTGCVVAGLFEKRRMSSAAQRLDTASSGMLGTIIRRGDLDGKSGQSLLLHNVPGTLADRVLLIGCGRERDLDETQYTKVVPGGSHGEIEPPALRDECSESHDRGQ